MVANWPPPQQRYLLLSEVFERCFAILYTIDQKSSDRNHPKINLLLLFMAFTFVTVQKIEKCKYELARLYYF